MLTALVLLLVPVATVIGLFVPGFYRDTAWMIPQARGQDLITLVLGEPLLIVALIGASRGFVAAWLLWMGTLSYVLYTYALFSYTAYFNPLFLVYVALFSASLFALIDLLFHFDLARLRQAISRTMPARAIAVFLALVGVLFLLAWLAQIISATLRGTVPESVRLAGTPSNGVFVQDLAVVIPLLVVSAVWLWQRRVWGIVIGAILLVVSDIIVIALVAMSLFMAHAQIAGALDLLWLWIVLTLVSLGFTALFAAHIHWGQVRTVQDGRSDEAPAHPTPA